MAIHQHHDPVLLITWRAVGRTSSPAILTSPVLLFGSSCRSIFLPTNRCARPASWDSSWGFIGVVIITIRRATGTGRRSLAVRPAGRGVHNASARSISRRNRPDLAPMIPAVFQVTFAVDDHRTVALLFEHRDGARTPRQSSPSVVGISARPADWWFRPFAHWARRGRRSSPTSSGGRITLGDPCSRSPSSARTSRDRAVIAGVGLVNSRFGRRGRSVACRRSRRHSTRVSRAWLLD